MGLMDVLNGMQNGPHGQSGSAPSAPSSGGMSPIMMAILGLIAYKAVKHMTTGQPNTAPAAPAPAQIPPSAPSAGAGGLGDILKGGLGSVLAGGAAGSVLSGGLGDLLKQLQQSGQGDVAKSWVGNGPNKSISSGDLAQSLGADQISTLMQHSGLSREELLEGLSQHLPQVVNQLTPHGRVPTEDEF